MIKRAFFVFVVISMLTVTALAAAPVIVVQPSDCFLPESAMSEGGTVSFSVVATGDNLSYNWESYNINGSGVWASVGNTTGRTANLTISATSAIIQNFLNNQVKFKCTITSSDGQSIETESVTTNVIGVYIFGSIRQMLDYIGQTVESIIMTVGSASDVIVTTPMLAIGLAFFFCGGVVAILGRLLSRN